MMWVISQFWEYIAGGVALIGGIWAVRRSGVNKERLRNAKDREKRVAAGQDAVRDGRASGKSAAERLRENDGQW